MADSSGVMLKIEDIAGILSVSRRTIYRMLDAGEMPVPIRFGKRMLRWLPQEITDWIAKGCPPRTTPKCK